MGELIRLAKRTWKPIPEQREEMVREYLAGAVRNILLRGGIARRLVDYEECEVKS